MKTLDQDGIRHDVRHAKAMGFCGTMPMVNWTPPGDPQWDVFYRTIIDESAGQLPVHGIMLYDNVEQDIALLRKQEALGVDAVLLAARYRPNITADELYDEMARRIEATDLPVILYAALNKGRAFPHLGPAGQPLDVYDRIADLPNIVALKVSQPISLTSTMQLCDAVADRLLVAPVNLDFVPLLARHYHMQWSGQWNGEAVQTPDAQLGNQLLAATAAQDFETADKIAETLQPVHDHFFQLQSEVIRAGAHPWQHNKYYSWLGGGNGGLLTPPASEADHVPVLTPADRTKIRAAFEASGLTPSDGPEESFVTGRAAWSRGVRAADMSSVPRYET
ncbi:dihydrodipicolinate synthase family protein [Henriciella sp. AS95]|uniref:dihydrodipicolinate synthase family protein n=1 Tax=Henriciella sp. AS95 TaxID=3135782 RepID=UPI003173ACC8